MLSIIDDISVLKVEKWTKNLCFSTRQEHLVRVTAYSVLLKSEETLISSPKTPQILCKPALPGWYELQFNEFPSFSIRFVVRVDRHDQIGSDAKVRTKPLRWTTLFRRRLYSRPSGRGEPGLGTKTAQWRVCTEIINMFGPRAMNGWLGDRCYSALQKIIILSLAKPVSSKLFFVLLVFPLLCG